MVFYNKKEEVLEIELTPHGRHLLSKGRFDPKYYEFYDDDILYDSLYGGIGEKQEEIQVRIKETPRLKVQCATEGVEKRYKEHIKQENAEEDSSLEIRKNLSFYSLPLANMSNISEKVPSTSLRLLNCEIQDIANTTSKGVPRNTKSIEIKPKTMQLKIRESSDEEDDDDMVVFEAENAEELITRYVSTIELDEVVLENGKLIQVMSEIPYILIDVEETEVDIKHENYEIFLYEIEEKENNGELYEIEKQIMFLKQKDSIINNIFVEQEQEEYVPITRDMAESFFTIHVDKEISNNVFCNNLTKEEILVLNQTEDYSLDCQEPSRIVGERGNQRSGDLDIELLEEC